MEINKLAHLLEPTHNARFEEVMGHYLPHWQHLRKQLNRLPVRHEDWVSAPDLRGFEDLQGRNLPIGER